MPWDPFKDGQASEVNPAPANGAGFDPFAAGLAEPVDEGRGLAANVVGQVMQGGLSEGLYMGIEGGARALSNEPVAKLSDRVGDWLTEKVQGFPLTEEQKATRAKLRGDAADKFGGVNRLMGRVADATADAREGVRIVAPVDEAFAQSLPGQIVGGLAQAVGTLPSYAVPGAGPGITIGQLYQQGYDDAKQSGADDGVANQAGLANVPAAALEVVGDRLIIGRLLRSVKGKLTVGGLLRMMGANAVSEGVTEGAQQVWQNTVASELAGYDPERPIDDQVINSVIVGAAVGSLIGGGGGALGSQVSSDEGQAQPDTGRNVPESPETIAAQTEQVLAGLKPAVMFPAGTGAEPAVPAGLQRVATERGVFHFDPSQVTAEQIVQASAAGRENEVLGLGPVSKPEVMQRAAAGDPAVAVTERQGDGTEVKAAVANASNADQVAASLEAGKTPGNVVAVEPVEDVVAGRQADEAPVDDFNEVTVEQVLAERQAAGPRPAPVVTDAGPVAHGEAATDSVPVSGETQPVKALAKAVTERSGGADVAQSPVQGKPKRGRFRLAARPDGVMDLLDVLQDMGGVQGPPARTNGQQQGGEYDGFAEAFGKGSPRLLVRSRPKGSTAGGIDQTLEQLAEVGYRFDSPDAFYQAVQRAAADRQLAKESQRAEGDREKFMAAALENEGRRKAQKQAKPVAIDSLAVGDTFKVRGEPFEVVDIDPDSGDVVVKDGPRYGTQVLPAGEGLYPDKRTMKRQPEPKGAASEAVPFASRAADPGQSDMFAGGDTGGDTLFNLQGETRDAATAAWSMDEELARREAAAREADAQGGFDFASRSAPASTVVRRRLAARQAQWRANALRVAPGLMQRFGIEFGSPESLVAKGKVDRRQLDGSQQAAYDAQERIFYLFDQALQANTDLGTTINLLHEMGHAHWDTLPASRREQLVQLWMDEVSARKGPLYVKGKLRGGVARGVEASVKEWYAERVAFANSDWARGRIERGAHGSLIKEAAAGLRRLLERMRVWVAGLRGDAGGRVDVDFRAFLDAGPERFAAGPAVEFASRSGDPGAPAPIGYARNWQQAARSWVRKWFTSAGNLPKGVLELRLQRDGRMAAIAKQVEFSLRDLDRAVVDVYGGFGAVPAGELARLNEVLGGKAPTTGLDARLVRPLEAMRRQVDVMSRRLVHEGVVDGAVAARVAGNVGFYLNRSYRKFDDKKWAKRVPVQVRNRAASFIRAQLQAQAPLLPVDEREVQGYLDYLLSKDVNEAGQFFRAPSRDGAKDLRVLTPRQEIPAELRELLGEYKDPRVNFVRSVAKTAQLVENHRYLEQLRSGGLGKWLFDRPVADATGSYSVPIAAEGSEALAPLNGTYTTPEIAAALQDQFGGRSDSIAWQAWLAVNGWAKGAKTVLSPVTQVRNFLGNLGFMVANGHWRANNAGKVWQAMRSELGLGRGGDTPAARAYVSKLSRLGILGQSVNAGELREALRDAGARMEETGNLDKWLEGRLVRASKLPFRLAARLYQANDEIFKVYAFENEVAQWRAAMPAAPVDQVEQIAAERVRNTLPTYSLIPRAVQSVRRVALTGSFVSFPAEVVRTGYHTIRYALQDLQSSNPAVRGMGAKRMAGLAAVVSLPAAVSMASRWLANLDAEDEEDLRRFLPEWSENSALVYQGNNGRGRFRLVDASYLDPWNYLKKPVTAALRGEDVGQALQAAMLEAFSPVASEGLMTKVVLDLGRNRQANGSPIWNPQAPLLEKLQAQAAHVGQALEPGLVTQARRMMLAAQGRVSNTGRAYNMEDEVQAVLTGARSLSVDVGQGLLFRAKTFGREKALAEQLYTDVKYSRGEVSGEEVAAAREQMEAARRKVYETLAEDVAAAQRLGVPPAEILQGLIGAGVSRDDAAAALVGFYPEYMERAPSKTRVLQDLLMQRE